ncbi:MAG TPA: type II secretion system F family protein [Bryobacteraceae bacterium]
MLTLLPFAAFLLIACVVGVFGYRHYVKPARLIDQLTPSSDPVSPAFKQREKKREFSFARLLEPIGKLLPVSPQAARVLQKDFVAAGIRSNSAISVFYGAKIVLTVAFLALAMVARNHVDSPVSRLMYPIAGAGIGFYLPSFFLGRLTKRRFTNIRLSLPDVLDLMVICTEAGCGLDQALVNVSRELKNVHPAVSEEIALVNMEIMAGKSRADAMRNLAKRVPEDEVKKLMAILIQTDRFGTSVSEALRTQSDYLRIRRRQDAEEKAGKVGVKLVFPIFFFCLPALLVVTAGSGILTLLHNLGSITANH